MSEHHERPLILCVDDDEDIHVLVCRLLGQAGFEVTGADDATQALLAITTVHPDLILLDVRMPGMDGYALCERLQSDPATAHIPVIFETSLGDERSKARAFAAGGVDFLVKPIKKEVLLDLVRKHLTNTARWSELLALRPAWADKAQPHVFIEFKEFLLKTLDLTDAAREQCLRVAPGELYLLATIAAITTNRLSQYVAEYMGLPYLFDIDPDSPELGVLPRMFSLANNVLTMREDDGERTFVLSNPFDWNMLDMLRQFAGLTPGSRLCMADPYTIALTFTYDEAARAKRKAEIAALAAATVQRQAGDNEQQLGLHDALNDANDAAGARIVAMVNNIFEVAVSERTSDIHIEPHETTTVARFRVDGDLHEYFRMPKDTGARVVSRIKVLAELDIAEKRLPQDGAFAISINNRDFTVRVATTSTPHGEAATMRLLEPYTKPRPLSDLGFTAQQSATLAELASRMNGLILAVGGTGSGKTTTIHSMLHGIDTSTRCVMTVEDPIEYRLPFATQQQVNEKADMTFTRMLKAVVRQDPDILFIGEIRDRESAQIAFDFASTGRFTIASLHTINATAALFRLERLGLSRSIMADAIIAIVAQKLLKLLCPHCKHIEPITDEERAMLAPFTQDVPGDVAHPIGCAKCRNTGYHGRQVVAEILPIDAAIAELMRAGTPGADIRRFLQRRGAYLVADHAIDKVRALSMPPADVYQAVQRDELPQHADEAANNSGTAAV
ncbi:MAG: ATPase, T2SS/T4P/T4SS family [bacterium]|nr:ATPase, T2SS/T4P/T4SS family [bacterium]